MSIEFKVIHPQAGRDLASTLISKSQAMALIEEELDPGSAHSVQVSDLMVGSQHARLTLQSSHPLEVPGIESSTIGRDFKIHVYELWCSYQSLEYFLYKVMAHVLRRVQDNNGLATPEVVYVGRLILTGIQFVEPRQANI